jgi:hypothetical protein
VELERLALHLRRRSPWEAVDLGCAMARRWWRPVLAAWLTIYLGAAVLVHVVFGANQFAAVMMLWWLKPVFDRAVLEVLAKSVFGERPRVREVLGAVVRSPGLIASLTLYRFDLARSFDLPVWHLERLRGSAASARARALHGRSRRHAVWTTIVFLHFEGVILLSLWGAIDLLTPAPYSGEFSLMSIFAHETPLWQQWLQTGFYVVTVSLLEPFYVAAGFALYLNRRTQLEAWDVELALRRFASRTTERPRAAALAAMLLLVVALVTPAIDTAHAAEADPAAARGAVQEILKGPEFARHRDVTRLRYTGSGWGGDSSAPAEAKAPFGGSIAEIARVLMWIAAAAAVIAALYYARRYWPAWTADPRVARAPPKTLFGLDIAPESLPEDVGASALALAQSGRAREALGLLYRGALSALVAGGALHVEAGDTEGDCVRRLASDGVPARATYFAALVAAWQSAAYAGRIPEAHVVEALCGDWRAHFGPAPAA